MKSSFLPPPIPLQIDSAHMARITHTPYKKAMVLQRSATRGIIGDLSYTTVETIYPTGQTIYNISVAVPTNPTEQTTTNFSPFKFTV